MMVTEMDTPHVLERARSCLLGQLAGDALGSMVEFNPAGELRRRYPGGLREIGPSSVWGTIAGQPTDDSELALILARCLLREGGYDEEQVAASYGYWRMSGPFDVGGTIGQATAAIVEAAEGTKAAAARRAANTGSQANGALMRQSPLAIWGWALEAAELDRIVRTDTALTHPNPVCQDASAAFIVAVAVTIREGLDASAAHARALAWNRDRGGSAEVTRVLEAARDSSPDYHTNAGWVLVALQNAFYRALRASSFEEGVVATVMSGGDTDTNAAIAGALLGAIHGMAAIPSRWRETVLSCRPAEGAPGVYQPRPRAFWPADALELADGLIALGGKHERR
jgi:ADP-ribosylglycohydrolase